MPNIFGPEQTWPHQDLIAFSEEFEPWLVSAAYQQGVFPMPLLDTPFADQMGWWSPMRRGILPLDGVRVTRSLRQSAKHYTTTVDQWFTGVLVQCANPERDGAWISEQVAGVYTELHQDGIAHSVEVWDGADRLVGGLYGVSFGGLFAGESMFHHPVHGRDASKVALLRLVEELVRDVDPARLARQRLLDVQWQTPHLASLGVVEVSRQDYLGRLNNALGSPAPRLRTERRPGWSPSMLVITPSAGLA